jgi:hypothetical protein
MNATNTTRRRVTASSLLRAAAAAAFLLAATAQSAAPQAAPELRVGQPATGTLRDSDPVMLSGAGPFHVYRLNAQEGTRLILTMRSGAFDAHLTLMHAVGGIHEVLDRNDDGAGGTDAMLRWTAPATGTYYVVAQALERSGRGGYTLLVEQAPPLRPVTPQQIRIGESRRGTITEDAPLVPGEDMPHDMYVFDARAGQELLVTLESDDFDAYLIVGQAAGPTVKPIVSDDDGGTGTNSRVRIMIPEDGRYGVQAAALGPVSAGSYTVTVREAQLQPARPLARATNIDATLSGDGIDQWSIEGAAGERVRVAMRSSEFDTMLNLYFVAGNRLEPVADNDDADDGTTDSFIDLVLPAAGRYIVRAGSFSGTVTGARYTIRYE